MTIPGNIEQKVRQLDNDVHAIYGMLTDISQMQKLHTNRFKEIGEDLLDHRNRLDRLEGKVDQIEGKVDQIEGKVDQIEGKVDQIDGKVDQILDLLQR